MIRLQRLTIRQWMIVAHDLLATIAALLATFLLRFEGRELALRLDPWLLTGIVVYAGVVYFVLGLHGPKWRFTSLLEFSRIVRAVAVLSMSLLVLDYIILSPNFYGSFFFGKITIVLYFVIQTVFLSGSRIAYRYLHDARTQRHARNDSAAPTLILGRAADVYVSLRAIENGAIRKIWPVGLLSPADSDQRVTMRGVPVMGRFEELENAGFLPLVLAERLEVHEERQDVAPQAAQPSVVLARSQRPLAPSPVGEPERDVVGEAVVAKEQRQPGFTGRAIQVIG
jgi:O-antigen biosynthesis protein WbqV